MQKNYPGKKILTFGYFFTEIPPYCKVEPNISISFCPITKNSKATMESPINTITRNKLTGWLKNTTNLTLREYFGLTGPFPRPIDAIAIADWSYANKLGMNKTYSEMYADAIGRRMDGVKTWNVNSLYFWTMTNGAWDPSVSVQTLREEFLKRVYGPAADDVKEFYRLTEDGWLKAGGSSCWNDKASFVWYNCVCQQNLVEKCREALRKASMKVSNEKAQKMLAALSATFEQQLELFKPFSLKAAGVEETPAFDPDFASGDWQKTATADQFFILGGTPSREKTAVKILYDKKNLYFGIKCFDKQIAKACAKPAGQKRDKWPWGDKFELFVTGYNNAGERTCNQIVFDINGNLYDGQDRDDSWNPDFTLKHKKTADGWSAMLTLPRKEIKVDLTKKDNVKVMFVRYWNHQSRKAEVSFWKQGIVHNYNSFGDLILD